MLQSTVNAAALAPVPPGTPMRYAAWRPVEVSYTPGSAIERVAQRLRQIAPGPEGGLVGITGAPLNSIVFDGERAADYFPAPADDAARFTTGVFHFNPKEVTSPILQPVGPRSVPDGMLRTFLEAFDYAYQEKELLKNARKRKKLRLAEERAADPNKPKRKSRRKVAPSENPLLTSEERETALKIEADARAERRQTTQRSIDKGRRIRRLHREQFQRGQQTPGGVIAGDRVPAMGEKSAWRSDRSPSLKMFVYNCKTQKKGLRGGDAKDQAEVGLSKMLTLNRGYIHLMTSHIGYLVKELDTCWESIGHLMRHIAARIPDSRFWPNTITCRVKDGVLIRPHLVWFFPPKARVWNAPHNPKCRKAAIGLLRRVQKGLCDRLKDLGCDPFYHDTGRTKNPLHISHAAFCIQDSWMSLDDWKNATRPLLDKDGKPVINDAGAVVQEPLINLDVKLERLVEDCIELGFKNHIGSQSGWAALEPVCVNFMRAQQRTRNPAFLDAWKDRSRFGEWMRDQIRDEALKAVGDIADRQFDEMLLRRCRYTRLIWKFDATGENLKRNARRGRDKRAIDNDDLFHAARIIIDPERAADHAREVAGRETSRIRRESTALRVAEGIAEANLLGLTQQAGVIGWLVKAGVIKRSQAYRVYAAALELVPSVAERIEREFEARCLAVRKAEWEARIARNRLIYDVPMPLFDLDLRDVRTAAHDKKQGHNPTSSPAKTINFLSIETPAIPVVANDHPLNPSAGLHGYPAPLPFDPQSADRRSNRPLLSRQIWAAVDAMRAAHRDQDRPTLH